MACGCNGCNSRGITDISEDGNITKISEGYSKLSTTDWLKDIDNEYSNINLVEVRFKNTHKEYFNNRHQIKLKKGDIVAVEAGTGHDIGTVSLTGKLVLFQIKKRNLDLDRYNSKTIYRKAKPNDINKWKEALTLEHPTMIKARKIIDDLGLDMKLGDVEYQGDKTKAIFYYIADERVDFRQLVKVLAQEFKIRIEMKQIGARQEAGRVGGIGSCGRELCCSTWKTNFNTVNLNAAKIQELSPNAQKLAGQCGKLKCCLMYELDTYLDARDEIPKTLLQLETVKGIAYHHKTDILERIMYYSFNEESMKSLIAVPVDRVKEIITLNKKGIKVDYLVESDKVLKDKDFIDFTENNDVDRFNRKRRNSTWKRRNYYKL